MKRLILFISLFFFATAGSVYAQGLPGVSSPLILDVNPTNPRPGETVSLDLRSYNLDINSMRITWTVDGKKALDGVGAKSFSVVAGDLGSIKKVSVSAVATGGEVYTDSASIRPSELTLFWQAGTYTPPFYKGKAMPTYGGAFKVIAMPEIIGKNGTKLNPKTLVYTWKKNDAVQKDLSGYGKTSFVTSQETFVRQGDEISVEITSPNDDFNLKGSITVTSSAPSIVFYEKSPLYGTMYERALGNTFSLANEELTVVAEPYFFSDVQKNNSAISYTWSLNGATVSSFQNKDAVTLRRTDTSAGTSNLGLTLQNNIKLLQGANKILNIQYE